MGTPLDAAVFKLWLGVEAAGGEKLPAGVVAALERAFADGLIEERDVPPDDAVLDEDVLKEGVALFINFYEDGAKALKTSVKASERTKMERWIAARYAAKKKDEKEDVLPPSKMLLEDMAAQGATAPWQLGWIELVLVSGRIWKEGRHSQIRA
jgi:hypothetical protein